MPTMIITGGAGFIGVNAAAYFVRRGWRVTVLDNFSRPGSRHNARWLQSVGDVTIVEADVRDHGRLASIFAGYDALDAVIHLAGQVAVTTSIHAPLDDCEANILGTLNVLEAVRAARTNPAFLYASTNKVYGDLKSLGVEEAATRYVLRSTPAGIAEGQPVDFHSPYGCSKGAADLYVLDYARVFGLRTVSLRQSCIYGPHQFGAEDQGWLAWFVISAVFGRRLTIFGNGKQVRDALLVHDLIDCYDRCIQNIDEIRGHAFNIGGGPAQSLSLLESIALLTERFNMPLVYEFAAARAGDQLVYVSDNSKALERIGWKPTTPLVDGITTLLGWVRENRDVISEYLRS